MASIGEDRRGLARAPGGTSPCGVARSRRTTRRSVEHGVLDDGGAGPACARSSQVARDGGYRRLQRQMAPPRRNVELKARDPDPDAHAGARPRARRRGSRRARQRDTYFAAPDGRLKLREQEPGGAELIAYQRPDAADGAREPLPARRGRRRRRAARGARRRARDGRRRRQAAPAAAVGGRADPPRRRRRASARFVELEGVAAADSDLSASARSSRACARSSRSPTTRSIRRATPTCCSAGRRAASDAGRARGDGATPTCPTRASRSAPRCAPTTAASTSAANVENAAYPQGQCAEASAIGAMVAAGRDARSPRSPSWSRSA